MDEIEKAAEELNKVMTHKELVKYAYRWARKNASCGVVFRELYSVATEIPDVIGFGGWNHSVLIECKASRSDFHADKKKPHRIAGIGMGMFRFYCCPTGMIKPEELPEKWGLIYVDAKGKATAVINPLRRRNDDGEYLMSFEVNQTAERAIMYTALRRLTIRGHIESIYKMPETNADEERPQQDIQTELDLTSSTELTS